MANETIPNFKRKTHSHRGQTFPVYVSDSRGPAVIILHELPGMSTPCIKLGSWLAGQGYQIHMPLFFGQPHDYKRANTLKICINRTMQDLARGGKGKLYDWIRSLCHRAHKECGGPGVGLIGMCLTGGFALGLVADDSIIAPIACQPSTPLLRKKALPFTDDQLQAAARAAKSRPRPALLGFGFNKDCFSSARWAAIEAAFGDSAEINIMDGKRSCFSARYHSTLTRHGYWCSDSGEPAIGQGIFERTLEFLSAKLGGAAD